MRARGAIAYGLALLLSTAGAAQGQDDRSITIAIQEEPIDLDPCTVGHPFNGFVTGQNVFETLTTLDPASGEIVPKLALSWETLKPGTWRFELRPGVKFHDGTVFDASAVKAALDRLGGRDFTCAGLINKIQQFDVETVVVDNDTIEMTATNMPLPLPHYLSGVGMGAPSTAKDALEREPVGTGPYKFDSWTTGEGITLSRFGDYWGDRPEVERVEYVFRQEANLRAIMVEAGEADIAVHVAPQDAANAEIDFPYVNKETTRIRMVMQPPLDDIRVRQALNLAFDRAALIGTVLSDSVIPATQFITPDVNGYNPDLVLWKYDLDEAKRLIEAARADGAPVDQKIRLIAHPIIYPNVSEALQVMAQMAGGRPQRPGGTDGTRPVAYARQQTLRRGPAGHAHPGTA